MERSLGKCDIPITELWAKGAEALEMMDELHLPEPTAVATEPSKPAKAKLGGEHAEAGAKKARLLETQEAISEDAMLDAMEDALSRPAGQEDAEPGASIGDCKAAGTEPKLKEREARQSPPQMSEAEKARLNKEALAVLQGGGQKRA